MAKKTDTTETEKKNGAKTPDFIAYAVIDRGADKKAFWREIGTAWKHGDGNGLQVRLDALPLDGIVTLRVPLPPKSE
jgi:hypothetical protein